MADSGADLMVPTFSLHRDDLVSLVVGQDETELVVHESCITRSSEFFKAAMKKGWTEGQTRIIKLPEEPCLETLRHYLNICYGQKLATEGITTVGVEGFPGTYILALEEFTCLLSACWIKQSKVLSSKRLYASQRS